MKKIFFTFCLVLLIANVSYSQSTSLISVKRGFATVMFAGLGGAVLGLSTLSFYGNPQERIGNIWMGATFGVLAGAGFVLVNNSNQNQASESYSLIDAKPVNNSKQQTIMLPIYLADF